MEVAHHPHVHESSKNWKSYFGEFLMLFLAVFGGFIAENLRENYVEKEKAHQYINSMISDLQKDTLQLEQINHVNKKIIKAIDSLLFYLREPVSDAVIKKLYVYGSAVGVSMLFENESGTITQLKNAGGLRLIKDTASVNRISSYDQYNEVIKKQGDAYYRSTLELLNIMEQIMDFSVIQKPASLFYLSKDADKIRLFYNKSYIHKQIISGYCGLVVLQKKEATKTIALLKKNYHIN